MLQQRSQKYFSESVLISQTGLLVSKFNVWKWFPMDFHVAGMTWTTIHLAHHLQHQFAQTKRKWAFSWTMLLTATMSSASAFGRHTHPMWVALWRHAQLVWDVHFGHIVWLVNVREFLLAEKRGRVTSSSKLCGPFFSSCDACSGDSCLAWPGRNRTAVWR